MNNVMQLKGFKPQTIKSAMEDVSIHDLLYNIGLELVEANRTLTEYKNHAFIRETIKKRIDDLQIKSKNIIIHFVKQEYGFDFTPVYFAQIPDDGWHVTTDRDDAEDTDSQYRLATIQEVKEQVNVNWGDNTEFKEDIIQVAEGLFKWQDDDMTFVRYEI